MSRDQRTLSATARGGCRVCHGGEAFWTASNAMAVAARHARATGHATWAEQVLQVSYGVLAADDGQAELFPAVPATEGAHAV